MRSPTVARYPVSRLPKALLKAHNQRFRCCGGVRPSKTSQVMRITLEPLPPYNSGDLPFGQSLAPLTTSPARTTILKCRQVIHNQRLGEKTRSCGKWGVETRTGGRASFNLCAVQLSRKLNKSGFSAINGQTAANSLGSVKASELRSPYP